MVSQYTTVYHSMKVDGYCGITLDILKTNVRFLRMDIWYTKHVDA